jgi:hypothetical protein
LERAWRNKQQSQQFILLKNLSFSLTSETEKAYNTLKRLKLYGTKREDVRDTRVDGTKIDESKRKFFSIGLSITYGTEKWAVRFRFILDGISENGPKGQTWLRFLYSF